MLATTKLGVIDNSLGQARNRYTKAHYYVRAPTDSDAVKPLKLISVSQRDQMQNLAFSH